MSNFELSMRDKINKIRMANLVQRPKSFQQVIKKKIYDSLQKQRENLFRRKQMQFISPQTLIPLENNQDLVYDDNNSGQQELGHTVAQNPPEQFGPEEIQEPVSNAHRLAPH